MEAEGIKVTYVLNQDITVSIETKKEKGLFKNKVTMIFENKDGTPLEFDSKQSLRDFLTGIDYEDNQTSLLEDDNRDESESKS